MKAQIMSHKLSTFIFICVCVCVFVSVYTSVQTPVEARKGHLNTQSWSYREL